MAGTAQRTEARSTQGSHVSEIPRSKTTSTAANRGFDTCVSGCPNWVGLKQPSSRRHIQASPTPSMCRVATQHERLHRRRREDLHRTWWSAIVGDARERPVRGLHAGVHGPHCDHAGTKVGASKVGSDRVPQNRAPTSSRSHRLRHRLHHLRDCADPCFRPSPCRLRADTAVPARADGVVVGWHRQRCSLKVLHR